MTAESMQGILNPHWFFLLFLALWIAITGLLSRFSGWSRLARDFPATTAGSGERFIFASGSIGGQHMPVNYSNCLFVTIGPEGMRLSILFLFRFLSPPFFLPWSAVASVEEKQTFFLKHYVLRVRDRTSQITLRGSAGRTMKQLFDASMTPGARRSI